MIGKKLAHYEVTGKIGAGGMGEVWRASDSKLGRDVALKMLPPVFAQDAERMARFQREAQVLASLNHPNIAAIYGLEEVNGASFLVLELVEGTTLSDRMTQGRVPTPEALGIARQIAEAVENAHETGVIHRDLKPANVKVTPDGRVKVLDFGLAKALDDPSAASASSEASPTLSPTLSSPITGALTGANVILGTAAYMSPEQARGQAVDKRADIWSFGVILFEMLTGKRHFDGETVSDTLAAVLRKKPDWNLLPEDVPPRIRRLLRRCLARDPRERLRDIGDARLVIAEVLSGTAEEEEPSAVRGAQDGAHRRSWTFPIVVLAAVLAGFAAALLVRPGSGPGPLRKYPMALPAGARPGPACLAPDASAIAFVQDGDLHVRELTTLATRELARDVWAPPFWSPDGEWIGYGSGDGVWKVRRSGGAPVRVTTAPHDEGIADVSGGAWRNGRILFTTGFSSLHEVSAQGGEPVDLVPLSEGDSDFHEMADLGGRGLAFIVHGPEGIDAIDAVDPEGARRNVLRYPGETLYDLAWSPTGHLLFRRTGKAAGIWALPLSLSALAAEGEPFLVAPGGAHPSVAADGTLAWVAGSPSRDLLLARVDRRGEILETIGEPASYHPFPSGSPDGRMIACRIREGDTRNLWFIDVERGSRRRFTEGPGNHAWGSWDFTGRNFWYYDEQWSEATPPTIFVTAANGTGEPRAVTSGHLPQTSPDGRWLLFNKLVWTDTATDLDLWLLDLSREGAEPQPLVEAPARQWPADFSPTDPLVAYATRASGDWEVQLTTYPERTGDWPVSTRGGWWPQWRGDGRELFYAVGDSVMAVDVDPGESGSAPRLSRPRFLFRRPRYAPLLTEFPDGFVALPDGESFVMHVALEDGEDAPPSLVIVRNWFREFEKGR